MNGKLHFRRQFLLSRGNIETLGEWNCLRIADLYLYSHPDLEVHKLSDATKTILLIGFLFDSQEHAKQNTDILEDILRASGSFKEFVSAIKPYAGRFVLIYHDDHGLKLVQDALSLREVYYCTEKNLVVCGSQPNLVALQSSPKLETTRNPEILDFYHNHMKSVRKGSLWVGDGTYYDGIKHLLPNQCLDLANLSVQRYWPNAELNHLDLDETVNRVCSFLQGMIKAVTQRHSVMLAVTGGTDSRTLLAASRGVQDKIYYFVNKERDLTDSSPDISVPSRIFKKIKVPFHVHAVPNEVDDEFRKVFLNNTFFASDRILPTIYNVYFKNHTDKINLLGVGEIGRALWGTEPKKLSAYYLAYSLRYKKSNYATRQCEQWLQATLPVARKYRIDMMTLLLWEQLLGNWGAVGNSESDIAIEEFDPYDSHYVYETLLGIDDKSVGGDRHIIFREMIRRMWPELLEFPINPPGSIKAWRDRGLHKLGFKQPAKALKYRMCEFCYHLWWKGRQHGH